MKELDNLIESTFSAKPQKKSGFNFEDLISIVSEVMGTSAPIINEEAVPKGAVYDASKTYDINLIPMPQFSELEWGTLNTPKDGGTRSSSDPRTQLAQYMSNIGGTGLRGKIEALNRFYSGEMAPEDFSSQSDKISKYLSYLVVYKTLTSIFTGFNASSAGFLFEPFLAIMLDAETGQQIPAAGANTIADFTIEKGSRPISLKAYTHGKLNVGGSFRQLVDDLTGANPVMEYIAVTKEMEGDKANPMSVTGKLHFKSFNFTLENMPDIIFNVSNKKHKNILELPRVFWDSNIGEMTKDKDFLEKIKTPKSSEVDVEKLLAQYEDLVRAAFSSADLEKVVDQVMDDFYEFVVDKQTGRYINTKGVHFRPSAPLTAKSQSVQANWKAFANQWPVVTDDPDEPSFEDIMPILQLVHSEWSKFMENIPKGTARGEKTKQLEYQSSDKTYARLKQLQKTDPETYKTALKYLRGVVFNDQFELSGSSLDKNIASVGGDNLFSYGKYYVGSIVVGRNNIEQVLERCINELNSSILDIFASLRGLTDSINAYVADGLQDDRLITDPSSGAQAEAQNIDKKTGEIVEK
tara:strand:+ start:2023 stop:3759 length:1737 start_codon:yes stop_codon:yes gene_type:complete